MGAKFKVPYVENLELWTFLCLKPGVGQSIAMHASPTARKVSIVLSDTCLPSPFTMFSKIISPYFFKKIKKKKNVEKSQIMKSRLQAWSKHCRLIACASAFYSQLVWLWVKTCHKWVKKLFLILFFKLFLPTVSFLSLRNMPYTCSKCLSSNGGKNIFPLLTALNASHVCDFWKEGWSHFRVHVYVVVVSNRMKSVWNCC